MEFVVLAAVLMSLSTAICVMAVHAGRRWNPPARRLLPFSQLFHVVAPDDAGDWLYYQRRADRAELDNVLYYARRSRRRR